MKNNEVEISKDVEVFCSLIQHTPGLFWEWESCILFKFNGQFK